MHSPEEYPVNEQFEYRGLLDTVRDDYIYMMRRDYPEHFRLFLGTHEISTWIDFICMPSLNFAFAIIAYFRLKFDHEEGEGLTDYKDDNLTEALLVDLLAKDLARLDPLLSMQFRKAVGILDLRASRTLLPDWDKLDLRVVPRSALTSTPPSSPLTDII